MATLQPLASGNLRHHLITLDGLRGIAALVVVIYHYGAYRGDEELVPLGWLAVDFFFMLSGFVLALAYGHALERGGYFVHFTKLRILRLWPMAFVGTLLTAVPVMVAPGGLPREQMSQLGMNLLMLPAVFDLGRGVFPFNPPLWSLLCEIGVNLAFALFAWRFRSRLMVGIVAASAALYLFCSLRIGHNMTIQRDPVALLGVAARTAGPFFLGVILHRLWVRGPRPKLPWAFPLLSVVLAILLALPVPAAAQPAVTTAIIYGVFPLIVYAGACDPSMSWLARMLGTASYPIYVIHHAILLNAPEVSIAMLLPAVVAFGWAAGTWIDLPLRRVLRIWFFRTAPAPEGVPGGGAQQSRT